MPVQLLALTEGPSIVLDKPILLLGRDTECDIRLDSRKISRRHCCIAQVGDQLVVRDLGSTNGIRVNGVRVVEGHLKAGDELAIGNRRYKVRWDVIGPAEGKRVAHDLRKKEAARSQQTESSDDDLPLPPLDVPLSEPPSPPPKRKHRDLPAAEPAPINYQLDDDSSDAVPPPPPLPGEIPDNLRVDGGSDAFLWARRPQPRPPKQ